MYHLITVDHVKALAKGTFDDTFDLLIAETIIPGVGKILAEETNQGDFDKSERTYLLDVHECERKKLFIDFPVDQTVSVTPSRGPVRIWTSTAAPRSYTTELVNGTDFFVNDTLGLIERTSGHWPQGPKTVKVVATTKWVTAHAQGVPPDLFLAASLTCKALFDNRENWGLSSISLEGGSRSIAWPLISKDIKSALKPYYKEPHV
jgi:hypothetical protein